MVFELSHGLNSNHLSSHPPLSLLLLYPPKVTGCASSYQQQQQQQLPSFSFSLSRPALLVTSPTWPWTQHICLLLTLLYSLSPPVYFPSNLFLIFLLFLCACLSSFSFPDLAECGSTVGGDRMIRSVAALTPRRLSTTGPKEFLCVGFAGTIHPDIRHTRSTQGELGSQISSQSIFRFRPHLGRPLSLVA